MDIKFDFDPEKFSRSLESAAKDLANKAMDETAGSVQEACDQVGATHRGKPIDEVLAALNDQLDGRPTSIAVPEENLRAYAEAIAAGRRVRVEVEHLR